MDAPALHRFTYEVWLDKVYGEVTAPDAEAAEQTAYDAVREQLDDVLAAATWSIDDRGPVEPDGRLSRSEGSGDGGPSR